MRRSPPCLAALLLAGCTTMADVPPSQTAPLPTPGDRLAVPDGYALVWHDEFDGGAMPSSSNWTYATLRNRKGWYNNEQQYYARARPENSRIEDGRLVIEARRESLDETSLEDWSGQQFSSARLTTRGKAAWRHGFFEVRAKLPCVRGAWPAIWLLPEYQDMRWQGGEIDIAEAVGYEPETIHHAIQTAERNHTRGNQPEGMTSLRYCDAFHDYQLLWTADRVVIGIDGRIGFAERPRDFDRPMALILNIAVGGEWAGAKGIDANAFPARMEVEHVRVYQPGKAR